MICSAKVSEIHDIRVERTRIALMDALTELVFANGFENVSVRQIAARAGTGRSTFYQHFRGKEDILRACMAKFFCEFAEAAFDDEMPPRLPRVLDHLWTNRRLTDAIFTGAARAVLANNLAQMIEMRLVEQAQDCRPKLAPRLIGIHLAQAQLGLVEAWLRCRAHSGVDDMALALSKSSRASLRALTG